MKANISTCKIFSLNKPRGTSLINNLRKTQKVTGVHVSV